ncbi:MAG: multicopper oxidase domain-containing protein, partial [Actinomycetota bacterium]|nr:multicopper oxidase domain-containing protein [Actinomycetota bacterium]
MSSGSGRDGDRDRDRDDDHGTGGGGGDHTDFSNPTFYLDTTPVEGSPETPGRVTADKSFEMKVFNRSLEMPDGRDVEFWGFEDDLQRGDEDVVRPSSPIRVTEGDIVHVELSPSKRQHTIHLHGIEIDSHNDGVGHTSFEVTGSYTYQFRAGAPFRALDSDEPQTRGAGTYLYHCHVNTVLHFQMGMWGPLIIDPIEGPGTAFHGGPRYGQERAWLCGDVDPTWRDLGHAAGMKGGDVGLNVFRPKYFDISGTFQSMRRGAVDPNAVIDDDRIAATGEVGGLPILVRYGNVGYSPQRITFHGIDDGLVEVDVIA